MKKLTRKTFITKDSKGCEFEVEAFFNGKHYQDGKWIADADYYGMGIHAKSLKELKDLVSNI